MWLTLPAMKQGQSPWLARSPSLDDAMMLLGALRVCESTGAQKSERFWSTPPCS